MKRTHDKFYLNENNHTVKQSFIEVADAIDIHPFKSIADVGCATGAFPFYLKQRFPTACITGVEYSDPLIKKAAIDFPDIKFIKGDVMSKKSIKQKYDIITMLGVLSIFDDYSIALDNVFSWLNPKGKIILHNMVSEYDIDVFVKYKYSSIEYDQSKIESGWNIISIQSLDLVAKRNNAKILSNKKFSLNIELAVQKDKIRSWTEPNIFGEMDIYNALHIRQPQKIVVLQKN